MADLSPYATAKPLMGALDTWLGQDDAERVGAYRVYDAIYRNVPAAFKLVQRGTDSQPIYLPSARTLIEAKNRFLAKRWTYAVAPDSGTDAERAALDVALQTLFRREQVWTKFATQKRYGLIRGDQVWHVTADATKPLGRRLSIYEVDPASYFPIYDPWNADRLLGVHLVDPITDPVSGKTTIRRQTYRKAPDGRITYELSWWEPGGWDDRDPTVKLKPASEIPEGQEPVPEVALDPRITAIPVYHIKNARMPGAPFGTSELAGYETVIAAVNQTISDQDLALAMEGLGLYATNSGPPVDEDGNETTWKLGPGRVVEVDADAMFSRVPGIGSVTPGLDHIAALEKALREAAGVPDVAVGRVDVSAVESGVALAFQMGPLLAGNEEKEGEILSVMDHLLYDLATGWLPVYEGLDTPARAVSLVDDPLPVNRKAVIDEILTLLSTDPPLISAEYARTLLSERLGYDFPDEMSSTVVAEAAALAEARNLDPFAARVAAELAGETQLR